MTHKVFWIGFLLFFLNVPTVLAGEFKIVGTEVHQLQSANLGETVEIAVALPFGYQATSSKFPLILVLDGDVMFGMSAEIPRLLSFEGKVPPMLVATIAYGDLNKWIQKRQVDFHPAEGGAERFLGAILDEVLPLLRTNYRIDDEAVGLYGHSSAGLFSVYAGLKRPRTFTHILATSPSLEEEPEWAQSFIQLIAGADHLPKFYLSSETREQAVHAALAPTLSALVSKAGSENITYQRLEAGGHMAVIPASYVAGLHILFTPTE